MSTSIQLSVAQRNAILDAMEVEAGTDLVIKGFTGARPANVAAANSGTELFSIVAPADSMAAASGGTKAFNTPLTDASANASGKCEHWRVYKSDGTTCVWQGDASDTVGSGSMKLVEDDLVATQPVTIATFVITAPGA